MDRDEDVVVVRELLTSIEGRALPERIQWGMVAHELLHWQSHIEVRWLLLCTALEGLVHTDDRGSRNEMQNREQFVVRLLKIREFVRELDWSEGELDAIYDHRNETMHGGDVRSLWRKDVFPPLYSQAENALRAVLRAAILNPSLAEVFHNDSAVRTALGTANRSRN